MDKHGENKDLKDIYIQLTKSNIQFLFLLFFLLSSRSCFIRNEEVFSM